MKLVTESEMKQIESTAMEKYKIPSLILMENAALGIYEECIGLKGSSFLVAAGKGNNGGDGLALARHLFIAGERVKVIFIGDTSRATPDCKTNVLVTFKIEGDNLVYYAYSSVGIDAQDVK